MITEDDDIHETPPVDNWLPIEEAPNEVTRIIAWDGNSMEIIEYGGWPGWCSHGCYEPTHWMPLPAPPEREAKC